MKNDIDKLEVDYRRCVSPGCEPGGVIAHVLGLIEEVRELRGELDRERTKNSESAKEVERMKALLENPNPMVIWSGELIQDQQWE